MSGSGDLFHKAKEGDAMAWSTLVDDHAGLVWSVILAVDLPTADRHDVFQAVFLRLTEKIADIRDPKALPKWLITVTQNQCFDAIRNRGRLPIPSDDVTINLVTDKTPEDSAIASAEQRAVLAGLDRLSQKCRQLLKMVVSRNPPDYKEVSLALGMPMGSIGPTRARCLEKLAATPEVAALDPDLIDEQNRRV